MVDPIKRLEVGQLTLASDSAADLVSDSDSGSRPEGAKQGTVDALRVLVLGANAWTVLLLLPWLSGDPRPDSSPVWLAAPLPALLLGAALVPSHRQIAMWLLLGACPAAMAGSIAMVGQLVSGEPYGPVLSSLGAASFIAFGGGAALAVGRPEVLRTVSHGALGSVAPIEENVQRRRARHALLTVAGAGALGLAVLAPAIGGSAAYRAAWGEAAAEAATLSAVVGGALGASLLALVVGPSLRASRARAPSARQTRRRALTMLGLFVVGLALYAFYAVTK